MYSSKTFLIFFVSSLDPFWSGCN